MWSPVELEQGLNNMKLIVSSIAVLIGVLLDFLFGDPAVKWHPICLIGNLVGKTEKGLRKLFGAGKNREFCAGILLVLIVITVSTLVPLALLVLCYQLHVLAGMALESIFCWFLLATKSLKTESMRVYDALKTGTIENARDAVSMIVGRDTKDLSEEGVIKATVETIAENTSDGSVAPLFYLMIGGAVLGFLYKSINTMDSMVGYKNETYLYFGRLAAKLDDVVNFMPSRIAAWCMILGAKICKMDDKGARTIYQRDRFHHASPNSAQTEAVMAGALDVELAGNAYYFGKLYEKQTIGDAKRKIVREDIPRADSLLYVTVLIALIGFVLLKGIILLCINMVGIFTII